MANWLTRGYNSTFGLPWQILMRITKQIREGDLPGLLDEDGLMDGAMIPILGMLDSHEHATDAADALDLDNQWAGLGIDILSDPATYMSFGATGAGKLANAVRKSMAQKGMEGSKIAAAVDKETKVGDIMSAAKKTMSASDPKDYLELQKHLDTMQGRETELLTEVLKGDKETSLMIAVPGLAKYGKNVLLNPDGTPMYTSWTRFLLDKTAAGTAKLWNAFGLHNLQKNEVLMEHYNKVESLRKSVIGGMTTPISPGIGLGLKTVSQHAAEFDEMWLTEDRVDLHKQLENLGARKGKRKGRKGNYVHEKDRLKDIAPDMAEEELHQRATLHTLGFTSISRDPVKLEQDYQRAIYNLTGQTKMDYMGGGYRPDIEDIDLGQAVLDMHMRDFASNVRIATKHKENVKNRIQASGTIKSKESLGKDLEAADQALLDTAFEMGQGARRLWRTATQSNATIESADEVFKQNTSNTGKYTAQAEQVAEHLQIMIRDVAEAEGLPLELLNKIVRNTTEASFGSDEGMQAWEAILRPSVDARKSLNAVHNGLNRMQSATVAMGHALKRYGLDGVEDLVEFTDWVDKGGIGATETEFFHEIQRTLDLWDDSELHKALSEMPDKSQYQILDWTRPKKGKRFGTKTPGERLGFMEHGELLDAKNKMFKQFSRKLDPHEIFSDIRNPAGFNLMEDVSGTPASMMRWMKLATKTDKDGKHTWSGIITMRNGKRRKLTPTEMERFRAVERGMHQQLVTGPSAPRMQSLSNLTKHGMKDNWERVTGMLKLREDPTKLDFPIEGHGPRPKGRIMKIDDPPATTPPKIKGFKTMTKDGSMPASLKPLAKAFMELTSTTAVAKKWLQGRMKSVADLDFPEQATEYAILAGAGSPLESGLLDIAYGIQNAARVWDAALLTTLEKGFKTDEGKKFITRFLNVRDKVSQINRASGLVGPETVMPGYFPHSLSPNTRRALRKVDAEFTDEVARAYQPQLYAAFARTSPKLSVDDINTLAKVVDEELHPEFSRLLKEISSDPNWDGALLETNPITAMSNHLANALKHKNSSEFVDAMLQSQKEEGHLFAGKVIGHIIGDQINISKKVSESPDFNALEIQEKFKGKTVNFDVEAMDPSVVDPVFLIQNEEGGVHMLSQSSLSAKGYQMRQVADRGQTYGQRFALSAIDGTQNNFKAKIVESGVDTAAYNELQNQHVIVGQNNVLGSMDNELSARFKQGNHLLRIIDPINHIIRSFQTIYRPNFSITNILSGTTQAHMLGTSLNNNIASHMESGKLLFGTAGDLEGKYTRIAANAGEARLSGGKRLATGVAQAKNLVHILRMMGPKGMLDDAGRAELKANYNIDLEDYDDLVFEIGDGQNIPVLDLLSQGSKNGLLSTYYAKGMEGSSATPLALEEFLDTVTGQLDERGVPTGQHSWLPTKQKYKEGFPFMKAGGKGRGNAELSELYSRFAVYIGRIREHGDVAMAARETGRAMVDYSQLTDVERKYFKRFILYYTFPRHYIPFALDRFDKSPRGLGMLDKGIRDSGVLTVANGNVELNLQELGIDAKIPIQRMNANIDAAMAIPAIAERILGDESLTRNLTLPGTLQMGGIGPITLGVSDPLPSGSGMPPQHWGENMMNSTWLSKLVMTGGRDLMAMAGHSLPDVPEDGEYLDQLASILIPIKGVEPDYERKLIMRNYKRLLSSLKRKAKEAKQPWRREALMREAQDLHLKIQDAMDDV